MSATDTQIRAALAEAIDIIADCVNQATQFTVDGVRYISHDFLSTYEDALAFLGIDAARMPVDEFFDAVERRKAELLG